METTIFEDIAILESAVRQMPHDDNLRRALFNLCLERDIREIVRKHEAGNA